MIFLSLFLAGHFHCGWDHSYVVPFLGDLLFGNYQYPIDDLSGYTLLCNCCCASGAHLLPCSSESGLCLQECTFLCLYSRLVRDPFGSHTKRSLLFVNAEVLVSWTIEDRKKNTKQNSFTKRDLLAVWNSGPAKWILKYHLEEPNLIWGRKIRIKEIKETWNQNILCTSSKTVIACWKVSNWIRVSYAPWQLENDCTTKICRGAGPLAWWQ